MSAFGLTTWAVNRAGWAFGYYNYSNPYAANTVVIDNSVYDYSQPLVMTPDETTLSADPNEAAPQSDVPPAALQAFDQARREFYAGDYEAALQSTDAALKDLPYDATIHEFRALTLFALGKYQDSAAALYAVLSVGPGWDWTTLVSLYPSVATYTQQLRALEAYSVNHPQDPAAYFVLAYQYMTAGHEDAAVSQLKKVLAINPEDQLAAQMLMQLDPDAQLPDPPEKVQPPKPTQEVTAAELIGTWVATRSDSNFTMTLNQDNTFSWKYSEGGQSQEVKGVWDIDEEGVLALEMNDEGVMLAQIVPKDGALDFYMLGDTQGEPPLHFTKQ